LTIPKKSQSVTSLRGRKRQTDAAASLSRLDGRARLILAAEALFASGGIDGVSLRQIAAHAGQGNHHAVQYYFATREGLVQAVFDYRMEQMEPVRAAMLSEAQAAGRLGDVRTLSEIVFLPQLALLDSDGDHHYASFLSQYLQRSHGQRFGEFGGPLPPALQRTLELLREALIDLPEDVAQRRLLSTCFMFLNILTLYGSSRRADPNAESFEDALDDTLQQIVCALRLPYRRIHK